MKSFTLRSPKSKFFDSKNDDYIDEIPPEYVFKDKLNFSSDLNFSRKLPGVGYKKSDSTELRLSELNDSVTNERLSQLNKRVSMAKAEIDSLRKENEVALNEVEQLEKTVHLDKHTEASELHSQILKAKRDRDIKFNELKIMDERQLELERELKIYRDRRVKAEIEKDQLDALEAKSLSTFVDNTEHSKVEVDSLMSSFDKKLKEVEEHFAKKTQKLKKRREALEIEQKKWLMESQQKHAELDRKIAHLQQQSRSNQSPDLLKERINDLNGELNMINKQIEALKNEVELLSQGPCQDRNLVNEEEKKCIEERERLLKEAHELNAQIEEQKLVSKKIFSEIDELTIRIDQCKARSLHLKMREVTAQKMLSIYDTTIEEYKQLSPKKINN